jgi:type I restriction enzyme M protein
MLDQETKKRIDDCRNILVGKVPDPKSQVEQITIAMIYKFMYDMDLESMEMGGVSTYFVGEYEKYSWGNIFNPRIGGNEMIALYGEGIVRMNLNPNIPQLFRDIFKNAYLPYRDPETLKLFLKGINEFHYSHSEKLGDAFEYLLSILGSQGDAGQFRTPRHIIDFVVELLQPKKNERILDPACGTSGFLISSYKHILRNNTKKNLGDLITPDERNKLVENISGYDISPDMVRLSLVNLYLHNFSNPKIYEYDSLTSEDRWNEYYDVILANPPFMSPKGGIKPHKRFSIQSNRAEVLFVDYIMEHLTPKGRSGIIVPEGIIFQSGTAYKSLRKSLLEKYLVGVISLPSGVFQPYSGVKTSILILDKELSQKTDKIFFGKVDNDGFDLGAQRREIEKNDLPILAKEVAEYLEGLRKGKVVESEKLTYVPKEQILESSDIGFSYEKYYTSKNNTFSSFPFLKIKDISISVEDGDWIESKDQSENGIRLIQTGNIGMGQFKDKIDKSRFINEETFNKLKCRLINEGEVLVSRLPDPVGRTCLVPIGNKKMITSVDVSIIKFNEEIVVPKYFIFNTLSSRYYENIKKYITGSSRDRISRKNLMEIEIPLPPIEVQEEIVRELEQYQKIIDGAKQVVDNYKPVIEIDPSWELKELGEICEILNGRAYKQEELLSEGKYPVMRVGNFFSNRDWYYSNLELEPNKYCDKGDLLYAWSASFGPRIWDGGKTIYHYHIWKLLPNENIINKLFLFLQLERDTEEIKSEGGRGIAMMHLTKGGIEKRMMYVPSLEIQKSIIDSVGNERQIIEGNKKLIEIYTQKIQDRINKIWGE